MLLRPIGGTRSRSVTHTKRPPVNPARFTTHAPKWLEALRLYGLPEAAPALLCGTPTLPVGQREFVAEPTLDLSSLASGAVHLADVAVPGARQGDRAEASLASSTRFIELDASVWSNNAVRVAARNISGGAFDLGAATLSVAITKRRIP